MRRIRLAAFSVITLIAAIPAMADDGPFITRRPGLWIETIEAAGGLPPKVLHLCTDRAYKTELWNTRKQRVRGGAEVSGQRTLTGGTVRMLCGRLPAQL